MNRQQRRAASRGKIPPIETAESISPASLFAKAINFHQASKLAEAEALYRQILTIDPDHSGANHNLGLIASSVGRHVVAVELIGKAVSVRPDFAEAHCSLGIALSAIGKLGEAERSYQRAVDIKPAYTIAHYNLGGAFKRQGKTAEAVASYRRALMLKPDFVEAHCNLGAALQDLGKLEEAEASCRQALAANSNYHQARINLGHALSAQNKFRDAVAHYRQALESTLHARSCDEIDHRKLNRSENHPIRIISASRHDENYFWRKSALGYCLGGVNSSDRPTEAKIYYNNAKSLPSCYNEAAKINDLEQEILVFMHDDVLVIDPFWIEKIVSGLERFDIIGLAGNVRRVPRQCSWAFIDGNKTWDDPSYLSGMVGFDFYGQTGRQCKLLDGIMLAVKKSTLIENDIRFDERFDFHFYDLDFCRQAEGKQVSMGTIRLDAVHQSAGAFDSPLWVKNYEAYLRKWGE
jgi:tetratricopeptide (TPR) repeat protein